MEMDLNGVCGAMLIAKVGTLMIAQVEKIERAVCEYCRNADIDEDGEQLMLNYAESLKARIIDMIYDE